MPTVLITGAAQVLGASIGRALGGDYRLRLTDAAPLASPGPSTETAVGDLRDADFAQAAVRGVDAIVHLAPLARAARASDLDVIDGAARGTYNLLRAAIAAGVPRVILGSSLDLLDRYPADWLVDPQWRPRPTTEAHQLGLYLAERSARECSRDSPLQVVCLRLDRVVAGDRPLSDPADARWLHAEDAAQAFVRALEYPAPPAQRWLLFHITSGRSPRRFGSEAARATLDYLPQHEFVGGTPEPPADRSSHVPASIEAPRGFARSSPIRRVVLFGAGGPLGAIAAQKLAGDYLLRLTDVRPLEEIAAEARPRSVGSPVARPLGAPHEDRVVDVADPDQVHAACAGMDAIVNCTVVREHPVEAFRVNLLGTYNLLRAALAHGVTRFVHTGPSMVASADPSSYAEDFEVSNDAPLRAGSWLYGHSKLLGYDLCRIFAEEHGLEIPVLLFSRFVNPQVTSRWGQGIAPHAVSWEDAGVAVRRAVEVPSLPRSYEQINILADLPLGKYSNDKARQVLGWRPRDDLRQLWTHD